MHQYIIRSVLTVITPGSFFVYFTASRSLARTEHVVSAHSMPILLPKKREKTYPANARRNPAKGPNAYYTVRLLTHVLCKPTHFCFHSFIATMSYSLQTSFSYVMKDWADKYHVWGTPTRSPSRSNSR